MGGGMRLLLAESGREEVGRAERSSWVAEFPNPR